MRSFIVTLLVFISCFNTFAIDDSTPEVKYFTEDDCIKTGIKPLILNSGETIMPRYDGVNYFIDKDGFRNLTDLNKPEPLLLEKIVEKAKTDNKVIPLTGSGVEQLITGNFTGVFQSFPVVLKLSTPDCYVVLLSLTFRIDETKLDIGVLSESEIMNSDGKKEKFYFGANGLTIKNGGGIVGNLQLIAPKAIDVFSLKQVGVLTLGAGTGFCLGCNGEQKIAQLILAGTFDFDPTFAVTEGLNSSGELESPLLGKNNDGSSKSIAKMNYSVDIINWKDVKITLGLPQTYGIQFTKFKDIGFWNKRAVNIDIGEAGRCANPYGGAANVTLDLSDSENPSGMVTCGGTLPVTWKGLYFEGFEVRFPKTLRKNGASTKDYLKADLSYFYISEDGINAKGELGTGTAHISGDSYKLGEGFDVKLKKIGIEVCANKLKGFTIAGDLRLPVNGLENYELGFTIGLDATSGNSSLNSLKFGVTYTKSPITLFNGFVTMKNFQIGVGTTTLIQDFKFDNLTVSLTGINNENGNITVGNPSSTLGALSLDFKKLVVSNKAPFVTEFSIFPKEGINEVNIAGFSVGLSSLTLRGNTATATTNPFIEGTACVTLELDSNNPDSQNSTIGGAAKLGMKAEWEQIALKEKYQFKNFDVFLTGAAAYASFPMFGFRGCIDIFKNATRYGVSGVNGFEGSASFWVNFMGSTTGTSSPDPTTTTPTTTVCDCVVSPNPTSASVSGNAHLLFMKVRGQTAWAANVGLKFNVEATEASPIMINEIFGGAYKNLKLSGAADINGLSNDYKYDVGNWGFNIGLGIDLNAYNANLNTSIAAQGKTGEGLEWIKGMAYLKFKLDKGDMAKKLLSIGESMVGSLSAIQDGVNSINANVQTFSNSMASTLFNSTEPIAIKAIKFLSKANNKTENKIAAGAVLTLNFKEKFLSLLMYPDININIAEGMVNAKSTGKGILYLSSSDKYTYIGKSAPSERIGLDFTGNTSSSGFKINAFVNAYFMAGNKGIGPSLPPPLVPSEFLAEFNQKIGSETLAPRIAANYENEQALSDGTGIAFGAAAGVGAQFTAAFVFSVGAKVGVGFDGLLTNITCTPTDASNGWGGTSNKNWRASAQAYGYANATVKMFFVDIASFGVAFLLQASIPNPVYAKGDFLIHANIWKAETNLKVHGEFGHPICLPPTPPLTIKKAELITKLEPNSPVSKDGNVSISFKNPVDQTNNTDAAANSWKQKVIVTFWDNNVQVGSIPEQDIDPKTTANQATLLSLTEAGLTKGKTYTVKIRTYIYTNELSPEMDAEGNLTTLSTTSENIVSYPDRDAPNLITTLEDNKEYPLTISNVDFLLNPSDVLLYPAKNQYNTYLSDFGGEGYFKIEAQYASRIKTACPTCQFTIGFYNSSGNLTGTEIPITDIASDFNFSLPNLLADNIYQIKITATESGAKTVIYDKHYFRVAKVNSFSNVIETIQNNQKTTYSSSNLSFDIKINDNNIIFSKEEIDEMITSTINFGNDAWFQNVPSCFQPLPWTQMKSVTQSKSYSLDDNIIITGSGTGTGLAPNWSYSPFDPAIFNAFANLANSQDLIRCIATCTDPDERVRNICLADCNTQVEDCANAQIPLFEGEHCFSISYDINKMSYYTSNIVGLLPTRFSPITGNGTGVCFDVEPPIDFNDLNTLQKTIEITCNRSSIDSKPLEYEVKLKKDEVYLTFPENITLTYLTGEDKFEIIKEGGDSQLFVSKLSSSNECPLAENFSVPSIKYKIEVKLDEEIGKPCVTFKDVSKEVAIQQCIDQCVQQNANTEANGQMPCDICNSTIPSSVILRVEGWESDPGKNPQTFHKATNIVFSNGKTMMVPKGSSFIDVDMTGFVVDNNLKITVDANSLYKCGDNLDKLPLNNLVTYKIVGNGSTASIACANTLTPSINIYGEKTYSNLVIGADGSKFYSNDITPLTKVTDGYYVRNANVNNQKEYLHFVNGVLIEKNYCVSSPLICMGNCTVQSDNTGHNSRDSYINLELTFYTDITKTVKYVPYNVPEEGLNITLSNGLIVNIPKSDINSSVIRHEVRLNSNSSECPSLVSTNLLGVAVCNPAKANCTDKPVAPTITVSNATPNFGETITMTANCGSNKLAWFNAKNTATISVVATEDSEYWVQCLNSNCLSDKANQIINIKEPKIVALKDYVCSGSSITLSLEGCTSSNISWTSNPTMAIPNASTNTITVSPTVDTKFIATCTSNNGGQIVNSSISKEIKFYQSPSAVTISTTNTKICLGESVSLNASTCEAYSNLVWSPSVINNTNPLITSPQQSTNYFAICKSLLCESAKSNDLEISVFSMTTPSISNNAFNGKSCAGKSVILSATACGSNEILSWYEGNSATYFSTSNPVEVFPTTTTSYSAKCRREIYTGKWCEGTRSNVSIINIITDMTVSPTILQKDICAYENATISANGCSYGKIEWQKENTTEWTNSNTLSISGADDTKKYYVRCNLNNNCFNAEYPNNNKFTQVSVHAEPQAPTLLSSGDTDNEFCNGFTVNLAGSCSTGTIGWEMQNGTALTNTSFIPQLGSTYYSYCQTSPTANMTCRTQSNNRNSLAVIVHAIPSKPTITSSNGQNICDYESTNIYSTACPDGVLYWKIDNGVETNNPILSNINQSHSYKVRCQVWDCSSEWSDVYTLTVHTRPIVPVITSSANSFVCGGRVTLTASDCSGTIHWYNNENNNEITTGTTLVQNSVGVNNYYAKCESSLGCYSEASGVQKVDIRSVPNSSITGTTTICSGISFTLIANNCTNGLTNWSSNETSSSITHTLSSTTSYTLTCVINECSNSSSQTVTVKPTPEIPSIVLGSNNCSSSGKILVATGCSGTVKWSDGIDVQTLNNRSIDRIINGVGTHTYTAKCIVDGCESANSESQTFTIYQTPNPPNISTSSSVICNGSAVTLTASNSCGSGAQFLWMRKLNQSANSGVYCGNTETLTTSTAGYYTAMCSKNYGDGNWCDSDYSSAGVTLSVVNVSEPNVSISYECGKTSYNMTCDNNANAYWMTDLNTVFSTVNPLEITNFNSNSAIFARCSISGCNTDKPQSYTLNDGYPDNIVAPILLTTSIKLCNGATATLSHKDGSDFTSVEYYNITDLTNSISNPVGGGTFVAIAKKSYSTPSGIKQCTSKSSNNIIINSYEATIGNSITREDNVDLGGGTIGTRFSIDGCPNGILKWQRNYCWDKGWFGRCKNGPFSDNVSGSTTSFLGSPEDYTIRVYCDNNGCVSPTKTISK